MNLGFRLGPNAISAQKEKYQGAKSSSQLDDLSLVNPYSVMLQTRIGQILSMDIITYHLLVSAKAVSPLILGLVGLSPILATRSMSIFSLQRDCPVAQKEK